MTKFISAATPSTQAITWLQQLLHKRIHPDLSLGLDTTCDHWHLRCSGADGTITMPLIPALYRLGSDPQMPCSTIAVAEQGFQAIEADLPAPGCSNAHQVMVVHSEAGLHLHYDIPGLIYWMLARCEEVEPSVELLDNHGRFPSSSSHAFRYGYLDRPIVDEWIGVLQQIIIRLWSRLPLVQSQFEVVVSHDVDNPSAYSFGPTNKFLRNLVGDVLKRKSPKTAFDRILARSNSKYCLHPCDPLNTFDWLMDTTESLGIRSAFYFMCGLTDQHFDAQYEPDHLSIRSLMRRINLRGHEIGLHPSYNTCGDPERLALEGRRLRRITVEEQIEQPYWGGRMHFLRWQWPATAYGWEQAGFHYDSTLSYADRPGFRCGSCHPYRMFDPVSQRPLRLIQRPLIAMECSVISPSYLGLSYGSESLKLFMQLKERCQAVSGQFTLLWHNSNVAIPAERELYLKVLAG